MADFYGIGNALTSVGTFGLNNLFADWQASRAAQRNYEYGERAAQNADLRTRRLYQDIYSPSALLEQYQKAGLSPSMMYGGTPGQGGMSGAQGTGAGISGVPFAPLSLVDAAQAHALNAQAEKTQAETQKVKAETTNTELQNAWQEMANSQYKTEFTLLNTGYQMPDGSTQSYYDIAGHYYTYDKFIEACKEAAKNAGDQETITALNSEQGQRTMRTIYKARHEFSKELANLKYDEYNANFQRTILECLNKRDFAEQNADTAIKELEAAAENAELTKEQKASFNHFIEKLRKTNSTTADIVIILSMLVGQYMQHHSIIPGKK